MFVLINSMPLNLKHNRRWYCSSSSQRSSSISTRFSTNWSPCTRTQSSPSFRFILLLTSWRLIVDCFNLSNNCLTKLSVHSLVAKSAILSLMTCPINLGVIGGVSSPVPSVHSELGPNSLCFDFTLDLDFALRDNPSWQSTANNQILQLSISIWSQEMLSLYNHTFVNLKKQYSYGQQLGFSCSQKYDHPLSRIDARA